MRKLAFVATLATVLLFESGGTAFANPGVNVCKLLSAFVNPLTGGAVSTAESVLCFGPPTP